MPKTKQRKVRLNLGSGVGLLANFINVDILPEAKIREGARTHQGFYANARVQPGATYKMASITNLPFPDNYADYAIMSEVLEHFPIRFVQPALNEVYRVLKPGATLVTTTPDFNGLARWWLDTVGNEVGTFSDFKFYEHLAEIVYGNQQHDGEFHRCPMTPDFVNYIHRVAGFSEIKVFMWERHKPPGKKYDGMFWLKKKSIMRTDTIVTEAIK